MVEPHPPTLGKTLRENVVHLIKKDNTSNRNSYIQLPAMPIFIRGHYMLVVQQDAGCSFECKIQYCYQCMHPVVILTMPLAVWLCIHTYLWP